MFFSVLFVALPTPSLGEYTTKLGYNLDVALRDYILAQTNITDPWNATNESNATFVTPYASVGYILQFGNYSWDGTMYVVFGTNSTNPALDGYTAGISWAISGVRTVEFDMYVYYSNTTITVVLDPATGKGIRIDVLWNESIRFTQFGFETSNITWIENIAIVGEWVHVVVSWDEPIANIPFRAYLWIKNVSAYIDIQDSAAKDPATIQITSSRYTTGDDIMIIRVDNIALYSKTVTNLEDIVGTPSVAFTKIADIIMAVLPMFMVIGLVGILIQKTKDVKFRKE